MKRKINYSLEDLVQINNLREEKYRINIEEEVFIRTFNDFISKFESENLPPVLQPEKPVLFIVGLPRSGSSLLYQTLVGTNAFNYISNFSSRFWQYPYIGLMLEKIIGVRVHTQLSFTSDFGKTTDGLHSPHEFMYFWDKWFAIGQEEQEVPEDLLATINIEKFRREVALIEHVFNQPVLFKSQFWLTLQIDFLNKLFPNAIFISTKRHPLYTAQSIALGRKKIHGDLNKWWSIKPKEYEQLKNLNWAEQIMGQVYYTEKKLMSSMAKLPEFKKVETVYESFCSNPKAIINEITEHLSYFGEKIDANTNHLNPFQVEDSKKLPDSEFKELVKAYEKYYSQN